MLPRAAVASSAALLATLLEKKTHCERLPPEYPASELTNDSLGARWPRDEAGMVGIPKRAWPPIQPELEEVPGLRRALEACEASGGACLSERFLVATGLSSYKEHQAEAAELYRLDAAKSHDAACALAQMHEHGLCAESEALRLFRIGADAGHAQSRYELGVLYYCGDDCVEEDEPRAYAYFLAAAESGHQGAAFMVGDCLNDGAGVRRDNGAALRWWVFAGDRGHRGARSRAFALTQPKTTELETAFGKFTDASRQTVRRRRTEEA